MFCHHGQDAIEHDAQGNEVTTRCRWCAESERSTIPAPTPIPEKQAA